MPLRALIFDLDGTLIDSLADIGGAVNHALREYGLPDHPLDSYRQFVGEGVVKLIERAVPATRPELREPVMALYRSFYAENLLVHTKPYAGIPEALDAFVARGVRMAILSNKPEPATRKIAGALFSRWPFERIHGERPNVPRKPDPTAALEIARAMAVPVDQVGFVGDTSVDMGTAVNAGMYGVGCSWGLRDVAELVEAKARVILERPDQLPAAVFEVR